MGTPLVLEPPPSHRVPRSRFPLRPFIACAALFLLVALVLAMGPVVNGIRQARHNALMQQGRQIGQCMFSYATDNTAGNYAYPDGNSSTEVFQKLIDGGYVTDPRIFFVPMPRKVAPDPNQKKLKPENVCWDVTVPVDSSSSDLVPLIFLTGYRISYIPGGSAVPLKPHPQFGYATQTWWEWLLGISTGYAPAGGTAVFYKGNNAAFLKSYSQNPDDTVRDVVSPDFKPDGHIYRQLTPDGVLK